MNNKYIGINLLSPKWNGYLVTLGRASKTLPRDIRYFYNGAEVKLKYIPAPPRPPDFDELDWRLLHEMINDPLPEEMENDD